MTRHVPRRHGDPPRGAGYDRLPFYGLYVHRACSAVVVDWAVHNEACHEHEPVELERAAIGPGDLAERANAEGRAVVAEFARPRMFGREAWRQVAACLRLTAPRDHARPPLLDPPGAAGRAEQWAAMADLIQRTTEA